ncbi:F0F1 ATP synthase subunit A [Humibacillus xanthopallidus]|uniref:F0F1 ATP synthase subunit A n=1 Tax=Humibacillus xanthopallidus TaxID=412689 RepID=UPI0038506C92
MSLVSAAPSEYTAPGVEEFWQPIIGDGAWAITRPIFLVVLSTGLVIWFLLATTRKKALVPGRGQMATEAVYGMVRNGIAKDLIGSKEFLKFVPLLFSLFMIILVNNFFGVIPPMSYPTFSRIGFPIALSLIVWVVFHVVGMKKHGFFGYWKSLVPSGLPKGMILPIFFLELITDLFTRPVTLALRLFGNMFAGHILIVLFITGGWYMLTSGGILVIAGGVTWVFAVVMTLFEMLVEFLQAYVFTLLSALYIGGALADDH